MISFLDDSDFQITIPTHSTRYYQCFGGIFVPNTDLANLEIIINETKNNFNIPQELPLKWNFRDTKLKSVFVKSIGIERYQEILERDLDQIRTIIFQRFSQLNSKFIISIDEYISKNGQENAADFAFTNLLQRYGIELRERRSGEMNLIIMDRDEKRMNLLCRAYDEAYRNGPGFHAGSLRAFSIPCLGFSVTFYNPILQLTDMMLGCWTEFLKSSLNNSHLRPAISQNLTTLYPTLRKSSTGTVMQYGIITSTNMNRDGIRRNLQAIAPQ